MLLISLGHKCDNRVLMKYRPTIMYMAAILFCLITACSSHKIDRTYVLDKVSDTEPRLRITKITVTDKETIVNCQYVYKALGIKALKPGASEALAMAPPGNPAAMHIIAAGSGKKYNLLKVSGIPTLPDSVSPLNGNVFDIVMVFERIDDSVKKIDIVEGNAGMLITWQFLNIQLP